MNVVTAVVVGVVFGAGIHLMLRHDAVRMAAGTLLISNAAVLLLVSAGFGASEVPLLPVERFDEVADPLVQALALTAIVIGFGTMVLLLRVTRAVGQTHGSIDMEDLVAAETSGSGEREAADARPRGEGGRGEGEGREGENENEGEGGEGESSPGEAPR